MRTCTKGNINGKEIRKALKFTKKLLFLYQHQYYQGDQNCFHSPDISWLVGCTPGSSCLSMEGILTRKELAQTNFNRANELRSRLLVKLLFTSLWPQKGSILSPLSLSPSAGTHLVWLSLFRSTNWSDLLPSKSTHPTLTQQGHCMLVGPTSCCQRCSLSPYKTHYWSTVDHWLSWYSRFTLS